MNEERDISSSPISYLQSTGEAYNLCPLPGVEESDTGELVRGNNRGKWPVGVGVESE
jgi:hypothetical protein